MTDEESLQAAIHEVVAIVPHDPGWAAAFEAERVRLLALRPGAFVAIAHIGSTAVPGLPAKPVIDLMAGVSSMEEADALVPYLCRHGYATSQAFNDALADRKWLMRWRDGRRTHHLHVVVHGGGPWNDRLAFRDALRRDLDVAARYAALKERLSREHAQDREAYTAGKAAFVRDEVQRASARPTG